MLVPVAEPALTMMAGDGLVGTVVVVAEAGGKNKQTAGEGKKEGYYTLLMEFGMGQKKN